MIGAEQRVSKPARKSSRNVAAAMGKRWPRRGRPEEQRYSDNGNFAFQQRISESNACHAPLQAGHPVTTSFETVFQKQPRWLLDRPVNPPIKSGRTPI
jgi:hypothetical protein